MGFRELSRIIMVLLLMVSVAWGAGVTGKWKGISDSGNEIALNLTVKGADLTGTVTVNGTEKPISNGKVDKDRLSFSMPALYGAGTVAATGKVEGDELLLSFDTPVGTINVPMKRLKTPDSPKESGT
jgi:hypothetical protein